MTVNTILHNSVSLDGSFVNFKVNMGLHYQVVGKYQSEIYLVGSGTAKTGIDMYHNPIPQEEKGDFVQPDRYASLARWVIPDSKGALHGMLHVYRRFEFCRDVVILVSHSTPAHYLDYLHERQYDYLMAGQDHVDFREAFAMLQEKYQVRTILADTGRTLGNILLNQRLANEISLLIHPVITGKRSENLFSGVDFPVNLKLLKQEVLDNDYIWISYKVEYPES
jgi:2,5-diamino-6-(ribosylamino)-4(3H)-pyrimidinone 5'-phosphate reductase